MHEWQAASVFWPTPNRSRPQDTHMSYRHVPHIHWGRGNNKYQTGKSYNLQCIKTGSTTTQKILCTVNTSVFILTWHLKKNTPDKNLLKIFNTVYPLLQMHIGTAKHFSNSDHCFKIYSISQRSKISQIHSAASLLSTSSKSGELMSFTCWVFVLESPCVLGCWPVMHPTERYFNYLVNPDFI